MVQDLEADPVRRAGLPGEIIQISTNFFGIFYFGKCLTNLSDYAIIIEQSGKNRVAVRNPDASVLELADRLA